MGLFDFLKKETKTTESTKQTEPVKTNNAINYEIDDMSYIADIKHLSQGGWHQYDILLAARGYGWRGMLDWADYMAQADLEMISKVSTALIAGAESVDVLDDYLNSKSFEETPALQQERGVLAVGGLSKTLGVPVEIVWFNQTHILRFLTITDDELLIRRYAEIVIRRTFNTPDSMKLARPVQNETA